MKNVLCLFYLVAITFALNNASLAQYPCRYDCDYMFHQGFLTDSLGKPVNGIIPITFGLYQDSLGGIPLEVPAPQSVNVRNGVYDANIHMPVHTSALRFMEVSINGQVTSPRLKINPVPFAKFAKRVLGPLCTANDTGAVAAGVENEALGQFSTVSGGELNSAHGGHSTIIGGQSNEAISDFSTAGGYRAKSLHNGSFVWADSTNVDFASTSSNQFLIRAKGGVGIGTNSPSAQLHVNGNIKIGYSDSYQLGAYSALWWNPAVGGVALGSASSSTPLQFFSGSATPRITVNDTTGNVGIGTATPTEKLEVNGNIKIGNATIHSGTGNPNGVVIGKVGDLYLRTDGGAGSTLYVKESGNGTNTGWVAK